MLEIDKSLEATEDREVLLDDAVEVLRARLEGLIPPRFSRFDPWGIRRARADRVEGNRILVELSGPGADVFNIEPSLRRALLEFKFVTDGRDFRAMLPTLDSLVAVSFGVLAQPLSSLFLESGEAGEFHVDAAEVGTVMDYLALLGVQDRMPEGVSLAWGPRASSFDGREPYRLLYVLEVDPVISNEHLADASARREEVFDQLVVDFELTPLGGDILERATGRHIGDQMAILLDGQVRSAPVIRVAIGGRAQIQMGSAEFSEVSELAAILRSGYLSAPLIVVEKRAVIPGR